MPVEQTETEERVQSGDAAAHPARPRRRIRLVFLIRSLVKEGAETQMVALAKSLDRSLFDVSVVVFFDEGPLRADLKAAGIPVFPIRKHGRWDIAGFLYRTLRQIRELKPDIIHGYMGLANVTASILGPAMRRTAIVWGIRKADMDLAQYDWVVRLGFSLECLLSRRADLIVANSVRGRAYHVQHGYPEDRFIVIPNGVDTDLYTPDRASGAPTRSAWGFPPDVKVIGLVARLDPAKDYTTFLTAAAKLLGKRNDVRFVSVGKADGEYATQMRLLAGELGLDEYLVWAGARQDMPAVYNALDIATLTSSTEGLPNAVLEAMACGVPCVVTAAGDAGAVVGNTGYVVPIGDSDAVAAAWLRMLEQVESDRTRLSSAARNRACECYSTVRLRQATEEALQQLADRRMGH